MSSSEVAKVREALEWMKESGRLKALAPTERALRDSFVANGLQVCDEYERPIAGHEFAPLHCVVCASRQRRLNLVTAILRDAGLLE